MELASRQVLHSGATASDAAEQLHPLPGPPCTADGDGDGDNPTRAARGEVPTDAPPAPADIERAPSARAQPPRPEGMAFNAPQLHAGKCAHTLCVISLRLVLIIVAPAATSTHIIIYIPRRRYVISDAIARARGKSGLAPRQILASRPSLKHQHYARVAAARAHGVRRI